MTTKNHLVPLAPHSVYSFGRGVCFAEAFAAGLRENGFGILPLTDTLSFCGLVQMLKAAREHGLEPFPGVHVPIDRGEVFLYPADEAGYRSICEFVTGCHYRSDQKLSKESTQDLSVTPFDLFARLSGEIRAIGIGIAGLEALEKMGKTVRKHWGITRNSNISETKREAEKARTFGAHPVALPRLIYAKKSDRELLTVLRAIQFCERQDHIASQKAFSDYVPMPISPSCMQAYWSWFPAAIKGNISFAAEPCWIPPLGTFFMPQIGVTRDESKNMLQQLVLRGLKRKYPAITPEITKRFEREFAVLCQKEFVDYFLAVHEIVKEAERRGHRVLGRGSAANSIISYALDITHVDPMKYGLFFERFLNPERSSPPDIDLDFSWRLRDEIYDFLKNRWGEKRVALISTHVTLGGRGALRQTAKAFGYPLQELETFSKALGWGSLQKIAADPASEPDLSRYMPGDDAFKRVLKNAAQLEGLPTHLSLHAGGVVIAPTDIYRFTPCQPSSKAIPMTQMEMRAIEEIGLVKIDLLAQRSLGVYADVTSTLKSCGPLPAILNNVEALAADPAVKSCLRNGRTMGVFYIESPGMRSLLKKLDCRGFLNLVAASSVIRPGVAESGMMQEYILRHRQPARIPPLHPILKRLLDETHGVMVYQEDVIRVANEMGNLSLAEGDILRRMMSGKTRSHVALGELKRKFMDGTKVNGIDPELAEKTWNQMESFSGYAFCKAHSASYAVLSLQLLWFKCHYPARFMAGVLDNRGGFYGLFAYVSEARRLGIQVFPPNVDVSEWNCRVLSQEKCILLGLSFVKNLSGQTAERIVGERRKTPFADIGDFIRRVRPSSDEYEALAACGAFRKYGPPAALRWEWAIRTSEKGLFDVEHGVPTFAQRALTQREKAGLEAQYLDFMLSAHPLDFVKLPSNVTRSKKLPFLDGKRVVCAGLRVAWKPITTKKHEKMQFITLEDRDGLFEVTIFPDCYKKYGQLLMDGSIFIVDGTVDCQSGAASITAKRLMNPLIQKAFY